MWGVIVAGILLLGNRFDLDAIGQEGAVMAILFWVVGVIYMLIYAKKILKALLYFLQKRYNKHNKQRKYDRHYTLQEIFIPCIVNCQSLEDYLGNLLLVGINYDVKTKKHSCVIEEFVK